MLEVKIKKLSKNAVIPSYSHSTDAGMDLTAIRAEVYDGIITYGTGLAFEIPDGYVGLIFPRSSVYRTDLVLSNCVGVIDSGYRGEVTLKFRNKVFAENAYEAGDRVGQMIIMPYPKVSFIEVEDLSNSDRGIVGYGSTGK